MENELIIRLQNKEVEAFEGLMNMHIYQLRAFVALRVPVPHLIDEIVQDTFIFSYNNIDRFKVNSNFQGWLRTIADNKLKSAIQKFARTDRNKKRYHEIKMIQSSQNRLHTKEDPRLERLERYKEQLTPRLQKLLRLKYEEELSTIEISEAMNKSMSWVRTNLCRIRTSLKKCMEASPYPELN